LWLGLGLGLMVAGIPVALVAIFGMPLPRHPLQQPYLHEWITTAAVLALWMLWLVLLAMVGLHVRATVRRIRLPHPRLADPPEGLLAGLVSAAVVAASTAGSRGTLPAPPPEATAAPAQPPPNQPSRQAQPPGSPAAFAPGQPAAEPVPLPGQGRRSAAPPWGDGPNSAGADVHRQAQDVGRGSEFHAGTDPAIESTDLATDDAHSRGFGPGVPAAGGSAAETVQGQAGVALPGGGWLAQDAAGNVVAAAGLWWLRRRRRYLPRPPRGSQRRDGDLTGLPETAAAIIAQLTGNDPDGPDVEACDRGAVTTADPGAAAAVPEGATSTAAVGYRRAGPLQPVDLPPGGVGLVGPGAADAARGIMTALLLSGGPGPTDRPAQVLTTTADVTDLLGPTPIGDDAPPGLTVHDTLDELLTAAEDSVLQRSRTRRDQTAGAVLLVVTAGPRDPAVARRLAMLLTHATGASPVNAILLGGWSYGPSWQVNDDGTTDPDPSGSRHGPHAAGARLCTLPRRAAVDLLTLQAQAQAGPRHRTRLDNHPTPPGGADQPTTSVLGIDQPATPPASGHRPAPAATTPGQIPGIPGSVGDPQPPLRLRLLGGTDLHHAEAPDRPLRLGRNAARQLLVFLAVNPAGATSAELAAAIWPGVRPRPTPRVWVAASTLRTALADATGVEILIRTGDRYQLDPRHLHVDLWELWQAVDHATVAGAATRDRALQQVVGLYRGELAAGQPWPWIDPYREAVRRHVLDAYTTLATDADPPTARALLEGALRADPVNEQLFRQAIATATHPDQVAALQALHAGHLAGTSEQPDTRTVAD